MIQRIKQKFKEWNKREEEKELERIKEYKSRPIISTGKFRCVNCKHIFNIPLKEGDTPFLAVHWRGSFIKLYTDNPKKERESGQFLKCPICKMDECRLIRNDNGEVLLSEATNEELILAISKITGK